MAEHGKKLVFGFVGFFKQPSRLDPFRDIAAYFGSADHGPIRILNWRNGQRNIHEPSIFSLPYGFKMFDPFSILQAVQYHSFLIQPILWNDDSNRLSDFLLRRKSEYFFRGWIPAGDHPVQIFTDNGVIGIANDFTQQSLDTLKISFLCKIAEHQNGAVDVSKGIPDGSAAV